MSKRAEQLQREYAASLEREKANVSKDVPLKNLKDSKGTANKNKRKSSNEKDCAERISVKRNIMDFTPYIQRGGLGVFGRRWFYVGPPFLKNYETIKDYRPDLSFLK